MRKRINTRVPRRIRRCAQVGERGNTSKRIDRGEGQTGSKERKREGE